MKPVIAVTTNYLTDGKIQLNEAYAKAITEAGGIPLLLPLTVQEDIEKILPLVDGVLLTGGGDIHPKHYGEPPHPFLRSYVLERDVLELALTKETIKRGIPFLGICRGLQVLNVALGGTLYQDLEMQYTQNPLIQHVQQAARHAACHDVDIKPNSLLAKIVGKHIIAVNSFHHQAVKHVAKGLEVVAKSADGIIEALVYTRLPFCVAVQWHPEEQAVMDDVTAKALFNCFIESAKEK